MIASRCAALQRDPRLRFVLVGLAMTVLHLGVLDLLLTHVVAEVANAIAFVVATQVNFVASHYWTWASRRSPSSGRGAGLIRRLGLFNASALVAFGANVAAFTGVHRLLGVPSLPSAVVAAALSSLVSFAVSSRVVFHRPVGSPPVHGVAPRPTPAGLLVDIAATTNPHR